MDSRLTKDIKDVKVKNQFVAEYKVSTIREKLEKIIQDKKDSVSKSSVVDYDSPSWSHKEADKIGYIRALTEVLELLNVK